MICKWCPEEISGIGGIGHTDKRGFIMCADGKHHHEPAEPVAVAPQPVVISTVFKAPADSTPHEVCNCISPYFGPKGPTSTQPLCLRCNRIWNSTNNKPKANSARPEIIETLKQAAEKAIEQGDDLSPEWLLKLLASDTRPEPLRDKNPIAMAANEIADFYNQNATMIPQPHHIEAILLRHLAAAPRTQGSEPDLSRYSSEVISFAGSLGLSSEDDLFVVDLVLHAVKYEAVEKLIRCPECELTLHDGSCRMCGYVAAQPQPAPRTPDHYKNAANKIVLQAFYAYDEAQLHRNKVFRLSEEDIIPTLKQFFTAIPAQKEEK